MAKSVKIIVIISMLVLLFDTVYAADNPPPLTQNIAPAAKSKEGWYKTKWGMTIDEIRTALKGEAKEIVPEKRREHATDFTYTIPVFKSGGFIFEVYMAVDIQKGLNAVFARLKDGQNYYKCFLDHEKALREKHGEPSPPKEDFGDRSTKVKTIEWITKDTVIRLAYATLGSSNKATNIIYQSRFSSSTNLR